MLKQELLASIIEIKDEEDYSELNEEVKSAKEPKEAISIIKKYDEHLKGENKKIGNIVGKQGEFLKSLRRVINSLVALASADLILISTYAYINFV